MFSLLFLVQRRNPGMDTDTRLEPRMAATVNTTSLLFTNLFTKLLDGARKGPP